MDDIFGNDPWETGYYEGPEPESYWWQEHDYSGDDREFNDANGDDEFDAQWYFDKADREARVSDS